MRVIALAAGIAGLALCVACGGGVSKPTAPATAKVADTVPVIEGNDLVAAVEEPAPPKIEEPSPAPEKRVEPKPAPEPPFEVSPLDLGKLREGDVGDLDPEATYLPVKVRGKATILSTAVKNTFLAVPTTLLEPASDDENEKAVRLPGIWRVVSSYRPTIGTTEHILEPSTAEAAKSRSEEASAKAEAAREARENGRASSSGAITGAKGGPVQVKGYTRRNGTYVAPYTRRR